MAELDYAFLADFAQVEGGRLTAVGASYTHATVPSLNGGWITAVAGRIRTTENAAPAALRIQIGPADGSYLLNFESTLQPDASSRSYKDGRVGLLFAALSTIPLTSEGLYVCTVYLDGELVRELAFEVEVQAD